MTAGPPIDLDDPAEVRLDSGVDPYRFEPRYAYEEKLGEPGSTGHTPLAVARQLDADLDVSTVTYSTGPAGPISSTGFDLEG